MQTDNPKQICPKVDDSSCLGPIQSQSLDEIHPRLICTCDPSLDVPVTSITIVETPK